MVVKINIYKCSIVKFDLFKIIKQGTNKITLYKLKDKATTIQNNRVVFVNKKYFSNKVSNIKSKTTKVKLKLKLFIKK
jgi:hypothetical protein